MANKQLYGVEYPDLSRRSDERGAYDWACRKQQVVTYDNGAYCETHESEHAQGQINHGQHRGTCRACRDVAERSGTELTAYLLSDDEGNDIWAGVASSAQEAADLASVEMATERDINPDSLEALNLDLFGEDSPEELVASIKGRLCV